MLKTIRCNNGLFGDSSLFAFGRDIATKDALGVDVDAGDPRYDRLRGMCELLSSTKVFTLASGNIYGNGGEDVDGSPLAIFREASYNRVRIYRDDWSTAIHNKVYNNGAGGTFDLMDGSVSGYRFSVSAFLVCKGLILAACKRINTSTTQTVGVALLKTTDYGTTWSIVEDASGNKSLPEIDVAHDRLAQFSLQNWMPCVRNGVAVAYGGVFTDYMLQPATGGGQCALWLATASVDGAPIMKKLRLGFTLSTAQQHLHTGGCQFLQLESGKVRCAYAVAIGDSVERNRIALVWIDCEPDFSDWETATININHNFHGSADYLLGDIYGYQFTSCCVGPDENSLLITSDYNSGYIHKLTLPTEEDDWSTAKAIISRVGPYSESYESAAGMGGVENFVVTCRDPINRTDFASAWRHKLLATPINVGAYSRDGVTWSQCFEPADTTFTPYLFWFGETICQPANSYGVYSWPKPVDWVSCRPLLIGHGTNNLIGTSEQWAAPSAGTTCTVLTPNEDGTYTIPSGPHSGQTINAPGNTEVYRITSTTGTCPLSRYLNTAVMNTGITTGCVTLALLPIDGNGITICADVSVAPAINCQSYSIDRWKYYTLSGNVGHTSSRPRIKIWCGDSVNVVVSDCLVQVISLHQDVNGGIGYPPPAHPNADADIHELAQIGPITVGDLWSVRMDAMIPELGWKAYPWDLLTIVDENGDWINVSITADKTVTLTTNIDSSEGTMSISTLYVYRWARELPIRFVVSKKSNSETELSISCGGQAITTTTADATLGGTSLTLNLASNADQSSASPLSVFGVRVWSKDDLLTSPLGPILSETDPDVDALETAAAANQLATDQAAVAAADNQFFGTILGQEGDLGLVVMSTVATAEAVEALDVKVDVIDEEVGLVKVKTDNLPANTSTTLGTLATANNLTALDNKINGLTTIDTLTFADAMTAILSTAAGKVSIADNGDGTNTATFYKQDGVSVALVVTYNQATGTRATTAVIP